MSANVRSTCIERTYVAHMPNINDVRQSGWLETLAAVCKGRDQKGSIKAPTESDRPSGDGGARNSLETHGQVAGDSSIPWPPRSEGCPRRSPSRQRAGQHGRAALRGRG